MKPIEILEGAISICSDFTEHYPTSKPVMYRRMNQRQQELFSMASSWDRDFYGICATVTLDSNKRADLEDLEEDSGVFEIDMVDDVRTPDPDNKRVHIVPLYDVENHLPPRMTLRSHRLEPVGNDMEGITQVLVYYSRRPKTIKSNGLLAGDTEQVDVELESPFDDLLIWDLVRDLLRRTIKMETQARAAVLVMISEVEAGLLASFEKHVTGFARSLSHSRVQPRLDRTGARTPREIIRDAQSICDEYTEHYPTTTSAMYWRINQRQQELFSMAAEQDREFYGVSPTVTLSGSYGDKSVDLREEIEYDIERIDDVRTVAVGMFPEMRVNIVPAYDVENHLAPRMTLRDRRLQAFGDDLDEYLEVTIYLSRRPETIKSDGSVGTNTEQVDVELEAPFDDLLVWDLARDLIRRTIKMDMESKGAALQVIADVEEGLLASYMTHVAGFAHARQDRFNQ